MKQVINAGETGLVVRTKLNENFTELYDSKITTIRGWGYQDFDAGVINSTTITLTDNTNGLGIIFDPLNVIAGTAFIVVASNNLQVPCTGTSTWLFSSKVSASNVVADTVTLSGVPHIDWGALRIFYLYDYIGKIPTGNIVAPKFISSQVLDILNASFVTDVELTNSGFITISDIPAIPSDISDLTDSTGIIPVDTEDLTNNAGFITSSHYHTESFIIACGDETTALTASTSVAKVSFRIPYAFTITEVSASVITAPTDSTLIVDIHDSGTTIMTMNKISIESGEYTSLDATTQPTLTDTAIAKDAIITIFCDQIGSTVAGAGLKVIISGHQ